MKFRDVLMLVNMALFLILGATILIRAPGRNASMLAYLMGCGFVFAGLYRLYLAARKDGMTMRKPSERKPSE